MGQINYARVALGAVVGGIVANAADFVINAYLLVEDGERMIQRLNLDPVKAQAALPAWIVIDFVYAFLVVWNYAAMRPRFGPGPGTAFKAGCVIWAGIFVILLGFQQMGIFTPDTFMKQSAYTFGSMVLMSLAGCYFYKESA